MDEEQYIQAVKDQNPRLLLPGKEILFKWHALETLLRDAFRRGLEQGAQKRGAGSGEQGEEREGEGQDGKRVFESIFGSFKRP